MPRPKTPGEMVAAIKANLPEKTGKTWDEWFALGKKSGKATEREVTAFLKSKGLGHVSAQLIARTMFQPGWDTKYEDGDALVAKQYAGKEALRPIYSALLKEAKALGRDIEVKPCETYVPLIRRSQFAVIQPSTKSRVDLGLRLKGVEPQGRLEPSKNVGGGSITHRISLEKKADVDGFVKRWLKAAYEANA